MEGEPLELSSNPEDMSQDTFGSILSLELLLTLRSFGLIKIVNHFEQKSIGHDKHIEKLSKDGLIIEESQTVDLMESLEVRFAWALEEGHDVVSLQDLVSNVVIVFRLSLNLQPLESCEIQDPMLHQQLSSVLRPFGLLLDLLKMTENLLVVLAFLEEVSDVVNWLLVCQAAHLSLDSLDELQGDGCPVALSQELFILDDVLKLVEVVLMQSFLLGQA